MADSLELTPTPFSISVISDTGGCVPLVATQSKISGAMLAFAAMPAGSPVGAQPRKAHMLMGDKKTQKPTLTTTTPAQELAIDVLVTGGTTTEAAKAAGVTRQTVSKWRSQHPGFRAELNTRRRELNQERADRIRDLDAQALATVAEAIDNGDTNAALTWVKARQLHTVDVSSVGSGNPDQMMSERANAIRQRPEYRRDDASDLLSDLESTISKDQAYEIAEAELLAELE